MDYGSCGVHMHLHSQRSFEGREGGYLEGDVRDATLAHAHGNQGAKRASTDDEGVRVGGLAECKGAPCQATVLHGTDAVSQISLRGLHTLCGDPLGDELLLVSLDLRSDIPTVSTASTSAWSSPTHEQLIQSAGHGKEPTEL